MYDLFQRGQSVLVHEVSVLDGVHASDVGLVVGDFAGQLGELALENKNGLHASRTIL